MDAAIAKTITQFATRNGIPDPVALQAVAWVESAGVFFWTVGGQQLPAIRFEGHKFYQFLKSQPEKLKRAINAGLADPKMGGVKNPNSWAARYDLLHRAMEIDAELAIEATSWGIGQVMGFHWESLGFKSAADFMKYVKSSVEGQLDVMWRFIVKNHLDDEIARKDWKGFARGYNGSAYAKNQYDTKMAKAYREFSLHPLDGHMRLIQDKLKKLGLYEGTVDGWMGPKTEKAIRAFQTAAGLVVDGQPGSVTVEQLDDYVAAKKAQDTKANVPVVAGGGIVVAGTVSSIPAIIDAVDTAQNVADKSKGLLETLAISPLAISIVVGIVVLITLGVLMRRLRTGDQKLELLEK